jgi:hypothetical protein
MGRTLTAFAILGFQVVLRQLLVTLTFELGSTRVPILGIFVRQGVVTIAFPFPTLLPGRFTLSVILFPTLGVVYVPLIPRHASVTLAVLETPRRQLIFVRLDLLLLGLVRLSSSTPFL